MDTPKDLVRKGWALNCPYCQKDILYTHLVNWSGLVPFFYSDGSNDVLLRKSDEEKVDELFERVGPDSKPTITDLENLWKEMLLHAPPAPNGGRFTMWANVRCPHCKTEFPYNDGNKDLHVRLYDTKIVLIHGAIVVGDSEKDNWKVEVSVRDDKQSG